MPAAERRTYCRICPVQCGLVVTVEGERVLRVDGDPEHPITRGYACVKGRALGQLHHHPERLDAPRLGTREVSWETLLDDLAPRLQRILDASGPDAIGFYHGTWSWMDMLGRRSAEQLARQLGTGSLYSAVTVDAVSRSYVAEQMAGRSFLIPNPDFEETELLLVIGMNPLVSHGHGNAMARPAAALRGILERGAIWVVDPRRSETARLATEHLAVQPGSDYALVASLVRAVLAARANDPALAGRATGVEGLARAVEPFTPERASALCGVPADAIVRLAQAIRDTPRFAALTGTGVTMAPNGAVTDWLVWCLQIVAGSFDAPGGQWFNPGQLLRLDERDWAPRWDMPVPALPSRPDLPVRFGEHPCAGLADEIEAGNLRALFVIGGNPVASLPETDRLVRALRSLDALVVADILPADTQQLAHPHPGGGRPARARGYDAVRGSLREPTQRAVHTRRRPPWRGSPARLVGLRPAGAPAGSRAACGEGSRRAERSRAAGRGQSGPHRDRRRPGKWLWPRTPGRGAGWRSGCCPRGAGAWHPPSWSRSFATRDPLRDRASCRAARSVG